MKPLMVILDNNYAAWQAAYTAYDVAARMGADLIGLVISRDQDHTRDLQMIRRLKTGARAAGVQIKVRQFSALIPRHLFEHADGVNGVFVSRASLRKPADLKALLDELACPLWIVPAQRTIRRILVVVGSQRRSAPELLMAVSLASRWQIPLTLLAKDTSIDPADISFKTHVDYSQEICSDLGLGDFLDRVTAGAIDLAVLGWPNEMIPVWEASQRAECILVICPTLNSYSDNQIVGLRTKRPSV